MKVAVAPVQDSLRGIAMMLLGIGLFAATDAVGKFLAGAYPTGQILFLRSILPLLLLLPFLYRDRAALRPIRRPGLQLLRVVLSTGEAACFFVAIASLPLADALTFYLAGPVYVVALSGLLLRERVGPVRWAAVLAGFAGVLVALRPSADTLGGASLIALAGSLGYAGLMLVTRALRGTPTSVLTGWQFLGTLVFGAVATPATWVMPAAGDMLLLVGFGVIALVGHLCVNHSLHLAPASVVVPYQYTIIVWATLNGWLLFGDVPHAATLAGVAIIVGAGLLIAAWEARHPAT